MGKFDKYQYSLWKKRHPDVRIPYSRWRLIKMQEETKDRFKITYQRLHAKYSHYKKQTDKLREQVRELKKRIRSLEKTKPKIIKRVYKRKVYKRKCEGCKKYERFLGREMDAKYRNFTNIAKLMLSIEHVAGDEDISKDEILILIFAYQREYITRSDVYELLTVAHNTSFKYLHALTDKGYLQISEFGSVTGKKKMYRYFLTHNGNEYLTHIMNRVSRNQVKFI